MSHIKNKGTCIYGNKQFSSVSSVSSGEGVHSVATTNPKLVTTGTEFAFLDKRAARCM